MYLISVTFQSSVAIMFYLCGTRTNEFVTKMNRYQYGVSENIMDIVKHLEKMSKIFYNYVVYGYIIFTFTNIPIYRECRDMRKKEGNELYLCGIYSHTWYPIYLYFSPVKEILYLLQVLELSYYIPKVVTTSIFFHGCIILTEARIEDLKKFLRNTEVTEKNMDEVNKRLKFAIGKYVEITE